jgi:hypothetical protein
MRWRLRAAVVAPQRGKGWETSNSKHQTSKKHQTSNIKGTGARRGISVWAAMAMVLVCVVGSPESAFGGSGPLAWAHENSQVTNNLYGVASGNGRLVVSGYAGAILTSLDGATWVQDVSGINPADTLSSATYGGGLFVVAGDEGTILTSKDGTNWASQISGVSIDVLLFAATCHNGFFVVGGSAGTILTSGNGTNWATQISAAGGLDVFGVTFGKGLFVAVGDVGLIMSSPDGTNWAAQVSGIVGDFLNGVAYGNGTFIVVGDSGILLSSPNGTNWTPQSIPGVGTNSINGVAFGNGRFVAAVDDGSIWSSADGTNWMTELSAGGENLFGASFYQGDQFIATGALGTILLGGSVRLGPVTLPGNGTLQFNVLGPNGLRVVTESKATLNAPGWQPIGTNTIANGFSLIVDRATNAARYYRARSD